MRELVTLHFGQAGVQLGNATWEVLCLEHGITENGVLREEPRDVECLETFFSVSHKGKFVPRSAFIDLEPSVVDEVRTGSYRHLFNPNRLITGPEDASNNFARGFFTVGKLILSVITHEVRKIMESCDNVHGLMIFRSLGGGTGSGLTSAIFDCLVEYPKTYKLEIPIYPSPTLATSTVEPYNSLLAQHFCMEDIDIGLLFDNEAAFDVCSRNLKERSPSYNIVNKLIAQICSNLTVSIRFENTISTDLSVLQNNLVPYPRIHFPLCSYAPMIPESENEHTSNAVNELTNSVFQMDAQLMKIDNTFGRIMSCALNYRGDISPYHVYMTLLEIKNKKSIQFVDWCPTGFKVGINLCPPSIVPDSCLVSTTRNVTLLTNTSAIGQAWQRLTHKFYMLYSKKSFVHWFVGEGMEECEFTESLYNISSLVKDYEECVEDTTAENTTSTRNDPSPAKQSTRASTTQNPKMSMQNTRESTQNPKASMQNPKTSMQNPKTSMQNPKASMQNPKTSMQNQKTSMRKSSVEGNEMGGEDECIKFENEKVDSINISNEIEQSEENFMQDQNYQSEVNAINEMSIEEEVEEKIEEERDEDVEIIEYVKENESIDEDAKEESVEENADQEDVQVMEEVRDEGTQEEEEEGEKPSEEEGEKPSEEEEGDEEMQLEIELEINVEEQIDSEEQNENDDENAQTSIEDDYADIN